MRPRLCPVYVIFVALLAASSAARADCRVPGDYASLQLAVTRPSCFAPNVIEVREDYRFGVELPFVYITHSVNIVGAGVDPAEMARIVVDGSQADAPVAVHLQNVLLSAGRESRLDNLDIPRSALYAYDASIEIRDSAVTNTDESGIVAYESDLTLSNVVASGFKQERAIQAYATGIDVQVPRTLSITSGTFEDDAAGAVALAGVDGVIADSGFARNAATGGPDVYDYGDGRHTLLVSGSTFVQGVSTGYGDADCGGAIAAFGVGTTIATSDFDQSYAVGSGGAICVATLDVGNPLGLSVSDTTFLGTSAAGEGGAIVAFQVPLAVGNCTFSGTNAAIGGGIGAALGSVTVDDSTFEGASAASSGGAIEVDGGDLTLTTVTVTGGGPTTANGAGVAVTEGSLTMDGSSFEALDTTGVGGAILASTATVILDDLGILDASAAKGGSLYAVDSDVVIDGLSIDGGGAFDGGALWLSGSALSLANSAIARSVGAGSGSAIYLEDPGISEIAQTFVCEGGSASASGAIRVRGEPSGRVFLHNDVIVRVSSSAGVLILDPVRDPSANAARITVQNVTIANNPHADAAILVDGDGVTLTNVLVSGQQLGVSVGDGVSVVAGGFDLWNTAEVAVDPTGTFPGTGAVLSNPRFVGSADDGCAADLHLQWGSPARDAGDPDITDPAGGRSDIGAYGGPGSGQIDGDGDGAELAIDCDDADPDVHPGATDTPEDGIDQDCDGVDAFVPRALVSGGGGCACDATHGGDAVPIGLFVALAALVPGRRRARGRGGARMRAEVSR
jgi:hypothetical protein